MKHLLFITCIMEVTILCQHKDLTKDSLNYSKPIRILLIIQVNSSAIELKNSAWQFDHDLINLLLTDTEIKSKFFEEVNGHWIFNNNTFVDYINDKKLPCRFVHTIPQ